MFHNVTFNTKTCEKSLLLLLLLLLLFGDLVLKWLWRDCCPFYSAFSLLKLFFICRSYTLSLTFLLSVWNKKVRTLNCDIVTVLTLTSLLWSLNDSKCLAWTHLVLKVFISVFEIHFYRCISDWKICLH